MTVAGFGTNGFGPPLWTRVCILSFLFRCYLNRTTDKADQAKLRPVGQRTTSIEWVREIMDGADYIRWPDASLLTRSNLTKRIENEWFVVVVNVQNGRQLSPAFWCARTKGRLTESGMRLFTTGQHSFERWHKCINHTINRFGNKFCWGLIINK